MSTKGKSVASKKLEVVNKREVPQQQCEVKPDRETEGPNKVIRWSAIAVIILAVLLSIAFICMMVSLAGEEKKSDKKGVERRYEESTSDPYRQIINFGFFLAAIGIIFSIFLK